MTETIKPDTKPTPVEVKIGDKTISVDPEVAAELAAARKQASEAGVAKEETEAKLAEALRKVPAPKKEEPNQEDDLDTVLFTNPKEAVRRIKAEVKEEVLAAQGVEKAQTAFWASFYEENPGLKDADIVVKAVMHREYDKLKPMTIEKARESLAEATEKELLRLGIQRKKGKGKPVGEGGNEPAGQVTKKTEGERPLTGGLTSVLKERASERRKSAEAPATT